MSPNSSFPNEEFGMGYMSTFLPCPIAIRYIFLFLGFGLVHVNKQAWNGPE